MTGGASRAVERLQYVEVSPLHDASCISSPFTSPGVEMQRPPLPEETRENNSARPWVPPRTQFSLLIQLHGHCSMGFRWWRYHGHQGTARWTC